VHEARTEGLLDRTLNSEFIARCAPAGDRGHQGRYGRAAADRVRRLINDGMLASLVVELARWLFGQAAHGDESLTRWSTETARVLGGAPNPLVRFTAAIAQPVTAGPVRNRRRADHKVLAA
jgi:hypothetical protein